MIRLAFVAAALVAAAAQAETPHLQFVVAVDPARGTVTADGATLDVAGQVVTPDGSFVTGPWPGITPGSPFTYEIEIVTPPGQVAVAPGRIVSRTSDADGQRVVVASEGPAEDLAVFVGPYEIRERQADAICTRTYFPATVASLSDLYLERSAAYVARFADRIGAPPFSCFSVVGGPLPVGLGFPGLTYVGTRVLPLPYMSTTSLAHEILHGWWGNGVRIDASEGNWAEGLTTLLADHDLVAGDDPAEARAMRERWLRDFASLSAADDVPPSRFRARRHTRSQAVGYHKVAMTLLMLRDRIGADAFNDGLRRFWTTHRFQRATWTDLRRAFEAASGDTLDTFFAQWINRAGAPAPRIESARAVARDGGFDVNLVIAQDAPVFSFTVPIAIDTGNGPIVETVSVAETRLVVRVRGAATPRRVRIDPDARVFRRLPAASLPPTLRSITFDLRADVILPGGDAALRAAGAALARALVERDVQPIAAETATAKARIVIGPPAAIAALRAAHPTEPEPPAAVGTTRAWASRDAQGVGWLWIASEDAASLETIARTLPHYGSRSWVVFAGAEAIDKGTWPLPEGWHDVEVASDE
jgi:hypothetical protein